MDPKVIVISGPTASGKTVAAAALARLLETEIISADSRQCYRQLNIGTAKPSVEFLAQVPHYFINSHDISQEVNAAVFEQLALGYVSEIFTQSPVAIVCGGTGLYIRAFCEGLDHMPTIPPALRDQVRETYNQEGLEWLQSEVSRRDPVFFSQAEIRNPARLMRALEVMLTSGRSFSSYRRAEKVKRAFRVLRIGLTLPGEILRARINDRVGEMMHAGLVEEVEQLVPFRDHTALHTLGYREIFSYLDGKCSLDEASEAIKTNTWQYARRQMTWMRQEENQHWVDARDEVGIRDLALEFAGSGNL